MERPARPDRRPGRGELDKLVAATEALGHKVAGTWNSQAGMVTGNVALTRPTHPTLRAAVARYHDGCPTHGSVFCHAPKPGEPPCTWYRDGHARIVRPTWPTDTQPALHLDAIRAHADAATGPPWVVTGHSISSVRYDYDGSPELDAPVADAGPAMPSSSPTPAPTWTRSWTMSTG